MVIKSVLREELENSSKLMRDYQEKLRQLPKGSLCIKKRKGHDYCYLIIREKGKVKFIYKGKLDKEKLIKNQQVKKLRAKYRNLLSKVKKQIKYLRMVLRGKEEV